MAFGPRGPYALADGFLLLGRQYVSAYLLKFSLHLLINGLVNDNAVVAGAADSHVEGLGSNDLACCIRKIRRVINIDLRIARTDTERRGS